MGNCLPFLHGHSDDDDLTRLESLNSADQNQGQRRRSHNRHGNSGDSPSNSGAHSSNSDTRTIRRHRNLQASSYVNQLYMNSAFGPGGDESTAAEMKALDEKRKARIRGLLEQIPIDVYVEGGKGDAECAICMGDFQQGDPIRFLPCMHAYHLQCIDDWLLRSFTCPSCMEPVDSALLSAFTVNTGNMDLALFGNAIMPMNSASISETRAAHSSEAVNTSKRETLSPADNEGDNARGSK